MYRIFLALAVCVTLNAAETVMLSNDFESATTGEMPAGYTLWRDENKGTVAVDARTGYKSAKSLKIAGAKAAALQYDIPVTAGEVYRVEALCLQVGGGTSALSANWKDANKQWNWAAGVNRAVFRPFDGPWRKGALQVEVPGGVAFLSVILSTEAQAPADAAWFDNVRVTKVTGITRPEPGPDDALPKVHLKLVPEDYRTGQSNREVLNTLRMGVIKHNNYTGDEGNKWVIPETADAYAKIMREQGYNAILTEGQRYLMSDNTDHAPYPDVMRGSLPFSELVENTRAIADACHKYDLKVYLHLTASLTSKEMLTAHPEWMTLSVDTGKPRTVWGLEWLCLNNPDLMKEYYRRLDILIRETKADGLMIDETSTMMDTCGCVHCRKKFTADTGMILPPMGTPWLKDLNSPVYKRFLEWRLENCRQINVEIRRILQRHVPDGILLSYYAMPYNDTAWYDHGVSIDLAGDIAEVLGFEAISNYQKYWALFIANMKLTRAVSEHKDGDVFFIRGFNRFIDIYYWWLLGLSQGSHTYWSWYVSEGIKPQRAQFIQWEMKHQYFLAGMRGRAETAVLLSSRSNNLIKEPSGFINRSNSFVALCGNLTMAQIPYKVLVDQDLEQELTGRAKTIVAMNIPLLSNAQADRLRRFVENGGTLIASAATSLYDENGNKRSNFALADLFGCDYNKEISTGASLVIDKPSPFFGNVIGTIPHPESFFAVKPRRDAAVAGVMQASGMTNVPGIIVNRYGKGQCIYFSGHPETLLYFTQVAGTLILPRSYGEPERDRNMAKLFTELVRNSANDIVQIGNLPPGVVVETYDHDYRDARGIQVHLLNMAGMISQEGAPETERILYPDIRSILPEPGKPVTVSINAEDINSVYMFSPDFAGLYEIPMEKSGSTVTVKLPAFARYAVLYFNRGNQEALLKLANLEVKKGFPEIE